MIATATILFDDSKNDLRALPKTVRLQLLTVLSFIWSTAFTLYFFGLIRPDVWGSLVIGHVAIIMASYYTFKQFHNVGQKNIHIDLVHITATVEVVIMLFTEIKKVTHIK